MDVSLSRTATTISLAVLLLLSSCTGIPEDGSSDAPADETEEVQIDDASGISSDEEAAENDPEQQESVDNGAPAGLSKEEIYRTSRRTIPDRFLFIEEEGEPVVIFYDLDNNGYRDALYLLVEKDPSLVRGVPDELLPGEEEDEENKGSGESESSTDGPEPTDGTESAEGTDTADGKTPEEDSEDEGSSADPYDRLLESWYSNGRVPREALSSISRLYSDNVDPVNYYLSVFLQTEDELISMYRIPLGAWRVLDSYDSVEIVKGETMPLCISSSFDTSEGIRKNWVIFSRYNKFSTLTLKDTLNRHTELRDLDSDGKLDIIKWSQVYEEGTGYETFLTWYRWDGEKYKQNKSTNVVRNINNFLSGAGRLLQAGLWEKAFIHMMGESAYREYREEGYSFSELFSLLFKEVDTPEEETEIPVEGDYRQGEEEVIESREKEEDEEASEDIPEDISEDVEEDIEEETESVDDSEAEEQPPAESPSELIERDGSRRTFRVIVFPKIMENPFRSYLESGEGPPYRVRLSVRFGAAEGRSFVNKFVLQMDDDPFNPPQFYIVPDP